MLKVLVIEVLRRSAGRLLPGEECEGADKRKLRVMLHPRRDKNVVGVRGGVHCNSIAKRVLDYQEDSC